MKLIYSLIVVLALSSFESYGAKKHCAELLTKLHNVQSQQRQGYSLKKGERLRKKEDAARKQWWDCENNRNKPKAKSKRKKKKSKLSKTTMNKKNNKHTRSKDNKNIPQGFSSNNIVIKSKFSGEKQVQWLNFYKRPKKCARPKTTQIFAYCMEEKIEQQQVFEQQY